MASVLQDWVQELTLREQGTLLTALRGCDDAPKEWGDDGVVRDTQARRLTAWLRWACMVPADPREVDHPGGFMQSKLPEPFKASGVGHYPMHWYSHVMHAFEVVAYQHPSGHQIHPGSSQAQSVLADTIAVQAWNIYDAMVRSLHLHPEKAGEMIERLTEDRIEAGTIVS